MYKMAKGITIGDIANNPNMSLKASDYEDVKKTSKADGSWRVIPFWQAVKELEESGDWTNDADMSQVLRDIGILPTRFFYYEILNS